MDRYEFFMISLGLFCLALVACAIFLVGSFFVYEYAFYKATPFRVEATLLSFNYIPSTRSSNIAYNLGSGDPIYYTSGRGETHTTIWDCGKYGRLISDNETIFRFARHKSILLLKEAYGDIRIYDIER